MSIPRTIEHVHGWLCILFIEIAGAKTGAIRQLVDKSGLWEPYHIHYSPQYGDKGREEKIIIIIIIICQEIKSS